MGAFCSNSVPHDLPIDVDSTRLLPLEGYHKIGVHNGETVYFVTTTTRPRVMLPLRMAESGEEDPELGQCQHVKSTLVSENDDETVFRVDASGLVYRVTITRSFPTLECITNAQQPRKEDTLSETK